MTKTQWIYNSKAIIVHHAWCIIQSCKKLRSGFATNRHSPRRKTMFFLCVQIVFREPQSFWLSDSEQEKKISDVLSFQCHIGVQHSFQDPLQGRAFKISELLPNIPISMLACCSCVWLWCATPMPDYDVPHLCPLLIADAKHMPFQAKQAYCFLLGPLNRTDPPPDKLGFIMHIQTF